MRKSLLFAALLLYPLSAWATITAPHITQNASALSDGSSLTISATGASSTTTQVIAPTWTLGATGTKMPFHIWATVEGASASGTVVNIQLVAPTVGDLVTIYRGTVCRAQIQ